ncbi:hypothetical protein CLOP_g17160 [Closterium sp. NIES-67]|nr:hypothetical protein CLOP_g17160 [Closterium sp. NIES-67]
MCSSGRFVQRERRLNRDVIITVANNENLKTNRQGVVQLQSMETNLMAKGIHLECDSYSNEFGTTTSRRAIKPSTPSRHGYPSPNENPEPSSRASSQTVHWNTSHNASGPIWRKGESDAWCLCPTLTSSRGSQNA